MPELAAELVRAGVEVIFAPSSTETAAALKATKTLPVVFAAHADPVGVGRVASLARPGGNATGMTMLLTDLAGKELEALKEALPNTKRFGVLFASTAPSHIPALGAAEAAARSLGVELRLAPVRAEEDFDGAFAKMTQDGVDGFMVLATPLTYSRRALLADLAVKHRLPSVFGSKENVVAGGLMSYAPDAADLTRRAASYVDKILKGAEPERLPSASNSVRALDQPQNRQGSRAHDPIHAPRPRRRGDRMSNCAGSGGLELPASAVAQHGIEGTVIILRMTATRMTLGFLPAAARRLWKFELVITGSTARALRGGSVSVQVTGGDEMNLAVIAITPALLAISLTNAWAQSRVRLPRLRASTFLPAVGSLRRYSQACNECTMAFSFSMESESSRANSHPVGVARSAARNSKAPTR